MKKKLFGGIAVLALAGVVALNVNFNTNNLSDSAMANVEALANDEGGGFGSCGPNYPWEECAWVCVDGYCDSFRYEYSYY